MNLDKQHISFTVWESGIKHNIHTYSHEYRNLMVLLNDRIFPDHFGECGGQGRCATCMVKLSGSDGLMQLEQHGNEKTTLLKNGVTEENYRLACQIAVNDWLNGAKITLVEE